MDKESGRQDQFRPSEPNFDTLPEAVDGGATGVLISCIVCEHEVPISEAVIPEATDYVVYLCGLDCYQRWISGA